MGENDRRNFLKKGLALVGAAASAGVASSVFQSCEYHWENNPVTFGVTIEQDITEIERLLEIGSGDVVRYPNANYGIPVVLVRTSEDEVTCFSSLCTHDNCLGNDLWVQRRRSTIVCVCHGSKFDASDGGKPVKGPAERPLRQFPTEFNKETNMLKIFF